jgi:hypothetical protein
LKIEVLHVPGCPNFQPAMERVKKLLASEQSQAEVIDVLVSSVAQAASLNFPGSPTIRIDGEDIEPVQASVFGLSCRLYPNQSGVPSEETVRAAIVRAKLRRRV